jgi:hypothetical protein
MAEQVLSSVVDKEVDDDQESSLEESSLEELSEPSSLDSSSSEPLSRGWILAVAGMARALFGISWIIPLIKRSGGVRRMDGTACAAGMVTKICWCSSVSEQLGWLISAF